ncbi:DUF427-domain-containing protein [Mytilinidion resinicola]|uniref:DUF427-domain-containing protein n=1 Tax=Mytilinidion resinicola TaxID=574789 RepID=A0A6A6ZBZ4_9PEZI|nr:DUF427-domain-containing protein [Mytilinidion resinicola]KAF2817834.1 DUF427-domain-containing protein [Mytilinidion resinicola]
MSVQDLEKLAQRLAKDGPYKHESTPRRVRGLFNGAYAFDTIRAHYVWEIPNYPQFYIPIEDFTSDAKLEIAKEPVPKTDGGASLAVLTVGDKSTVKVISFKKGPLAGLVKTIFGAIDQWFEEETPIYIHPKDPYKRISILPSTRRVRVALDGVTLAETSASIFLLETSLRPRYYIPPTSVNWHLLSKSDTESGCPYKGTANYYNAEVNGKVYRDIVWWYQHPTMESAPIAGYLCFYNERVDVHIDGIKEDR